LKNKSPLPVYWKCQLTGWSLAALYWGYLGYTGDGFSFPLGIIHFLSDVFIYILITHLYHLYAVKHKFKELAFNHLLKRILPAVIILGTAYTLVTVLKIYLIRSWFSPDFSQSFFPFVSFNVLKIFVAGIRLMSIWLLAYHLYQYAQREIKVTQENARLAVISRDAQLNSLAAQLNPHFLFNSLNNIKALIVENPKSARRGIDLLSELLRNSLYNHDSMSISIRQEMDLVRDYLELEKLRFEERLQYGIEADNELDEQLIPRLSIQTLVENAIKHGVIQVKDIALVTIKVLRENNFIKITVQNPGRLDSFRLAGGIGLKNLKERLRLQFNGEAEFDITDQQNGFIMATILIPHK